MGDRTKLPKWAQKEMERLEIYLSQTKLSLAQLMEKQTPSSVYIDRILSDKPGAPSFDKQYLDTRHVTFVLGKDGVNRELEVNVRLTEDENDEPELTISSSFSTLSIRPSCSNVIKLKAIR